MKEPKQIKRWLLELPAPDHGCIKANGSLTPDAKDALAFDSEEKAAAELPRWLKRYPTAVVSKYIWEENVK